MAKWWFRLRGSQSQSQMTVDNIIRSIRNEKHYICTSTRCITSKLDKEVTKKDELSPIKLYDPFLTHVVMWIHITNEKRIYISTELIATKFSRIEVWVKDSQLPGHITTWLMNDGKWIFQIKTEISTLQDFRSTKRGWVETNNETRFDQIMLSTPH